MTTRARVRGTGTEQFGNLLRGWRHERRLSQEALSHQAGVSQRHLSCLESGRSAPSREMVLHLSQALEIPLRERNLLLTAAGFAPAYAHRPLDGPDLAVVQQAVTVMLDGLQPCPAIVVDRDWNLVRANDAALAVFSVFVDLGTVFDAVAGADGGANVHRLLFHPKGLRPHIVDWAEVAPALLQRVEREVAADPAWALGATLLDDLRTLAEVDADTGTAAPTSDPVLSFTLQRGDVRLKLFSMIATFGTAQDVTVQELRIETFFPADAGTRAALEQLIGGAS